MIGKKLYLGLLITNVVFSVTSTVNYVKAGNILGVAFALMPLLIISLYFARIWLTTFLSVAWVMLLGASNGTWLAPLALAAQKNSHKKYAIAITVVLTATFVRLYFIDRIIDTAEIGVILTTFLTILLFDLQAKGYIQINNVAPAAQQQPAPEPPSEEEQELTPQQLAQLQKVVANLSAQVDVARLKRASGQHLSENGVDYLLTQIKVLQLVKLDYDKMAPRYLGGKTDNTVPNKETGKPYDKDTIIKCRARVMQYNNLNNEYELASCLITHAVKIIDSYDKQKLAEGSKNWKAKKTKL
jgi:hypothetical protein